LTGPRPTLLYLCMRCVPWLTVLVAALAAASAAAQVSYDPYEQIYGAPIDVPLAELAQGAVPYNGRPVRTAGRVEICMTQDVTTRQYCLREGGYSVLLVARPEIASSWEYEAMRLLGARLQVVGLYEPSQQAAFGPAGVLEFWKYVTLREDDTSDRARSREVRLRALLQDPAKHSGALVRVLGEFRGRNLFGDLPAASQRGPQDWVLRDEGDAIWVTGKPPRGSGWRLDATLKRDSGKWLEVVGRVQVSQGTVYVRASSVELGRRPTQTNVAPLAALAERAKAPPQVVFSLPLDGEREIPADARFILQFSNDMEETTFTGRVQLRYAETDPRGVPFPRIVVSYDPGRRALTIDPGDRLRAGRELELLLLPGIKDVEALELVPRSIPGPAGSLDLLRFSIAP
jgi:hypothetical protein